MQLTVCVGSCCYSKGAQEIIDFIKSDYPDVEVVGAFCLGSCSQGVSIKIDGNIRLIKNCDDIKNIMKELK